MSQLEHRLSAGAAVLAPARAAVSADAGPRFDWLVVGATVWLMGGLYADGWAHGYGLPDSFWTVWHAIFYSGSAAVSAVVLGATALRRPGRASWRDAVPRGYLASVAGAFVFAAGGVFDLAWHQTFGIEVGNDALLSPSHLMLGLGIALLVTGPLRSAFARGAGGAAAGRWPMVLSLTALFSLLTFFALYSGPYSGLLGVKGSSLRGDTVFRALLGVFTFSALASGLLLVALRRATLPVGALTAFFGVNGIAMIAMQGHTEVAVQVAFSAVAVAAGLAGDVLLRVLRPSAVRPGALRAFAALVPAIFFALYFATVFLLAGIAWTFTFVSGAVVLCGVVGLLLSYVALPPAIEPAAAD